MICKSCGKEIDDDSLFCEFCGTKNCNEKKAEKNKLKKQGSNKKILLSVLSIIIIALLACSVWFLFFNNVSNKSSNEPIKQSSSVFDTLRSGTWYIDTKEYGPARGEGTYFDYINFLDEKTYEKTWLMRGNKSTAEYEIIDDYLILNDVEREDNLDGDIYHYDLVCKIDTENLVIYAFYELERVYENDNNAWMYIIEETDQLYHTINDVIKNIVKENNSEVFLRCQTDKLKNELQSSIWTIQSWPSNDESIDDEYLSNAMYFSNDNMCYYWNSSNIDYDDPDCLYTEFYNSTIYSIENNIITFGNGKTLSIIENPEENTYFLAEHTGCQYRVNKNYSLSN